MVRTSAQESLITESFAPSLLLCSRYHSRDFPFGRDIGVWLVHSLPFPRVRGYFFLGRWNYGVAGALTPLMLPRMRSYSVVFMQRVLTLPL